MFVQFLLSKDQFERLVEQSKIAFEKHGAEALSCIIYNADQTCPKTLDIAAFNDKGIIDEFWPEEDGLPEITLEDNNRIVHED